MTPPVSVPRTLDDPLYEVVHGTRVELGPMGAHETDLAGILSGFLWSYARQHNLGRVEPEMLFLLDSKAGLQRRPDVAFVSCARWPRRRRVPRTSAWAVVPELTVEVVSPSNTAEEVLVKLRDYFTAGVQLAWVVYPELEQVYVYTSLTTVQILDRAATLEGGNVLPGFRLALAELFEETDEEPTA